MFCYSKPVQGLAVQRRLSIETSARRSTRRLCRRRLLLAAILTIYAGFVAAQGDNGGNGSGVHGSLSLSSEYVANLDGGIAQGNANNHLLVAGVSVDGGAVGLPASSELRASFIHTWNDQPSANLVGDTQGFSNIAATPRSSLYTLWYHQPLAEGRWAADLGLVPADHFFDVADSAGLLINSSFGAQPTWSANTVAPIYPTAGVGAMATLSSGRWLNRAGIFQADPRDRSSAFERGFLLLDEVNFSASAATTYKVGAWSYRPHDSPSALLPETTWGGYAIAERSLDTGANAPTAFVRAGWSPPQASTVPLGFQIGVLVPAPFAARPDDQFSAGIASAHLRDQGVETAYEVTYLFALDAHVSLQPDLQYITNPAGTFPAATVATVRLHVDF
jgi:porin